jgi:hypothetical protein
VLCSCRTVEPGDNGSEVPCVDLNEKPLYGPETNAP